MFHQSTLEHYSKFMVILWTSSLIANSFAESTAESSNADIDATNSGQLSLQVDHSLDDGYTFSTRGNLLIHSLRSGSASMDTSGGDGDESSVSEEQKESLRKLCDRDDLYLLRLIGQDGSTHRTATHACNLVNSGLSEVFTVHLDWRNKVVGVSISAGSAAGDQKKRGHSDTLSTVIDENIDLLDSAGGFKSKVLVQPMEMGPQPDTAAFIQRVEKEKLAKERGETTDNRSFFAKYWMYIIPVVLFLAMSSANPEAAR